MKKILYGALLALLPLPAVAQSTAVDADPALWVVQDEDTTVYLFGTYHLLDGKREWFNDNVKAAFDASNELVMEAKVPKDPSELQPLIVKYAVDPAGKTLSSKLPAETAKKLGEELSAMGAPAVAFEPFEPWFATMSLAALKMQSLGLKPEHGPETVLMTAASEENKAIAELEGFEYQLRLFDQIPEEQQIVYLKETLEQLSQSDAMINEMLAAWSNGDPDKLATLMNEGISESPELYDMLFTRRNENWANWIDNRLDTPGTVFVAVGAGHLAGEDSVQKLLAQRGIGSARVPN